MARGRRRGRGHGGEGEESNERWLLTYADMITLLMALFMVLFSISSVNISKVQVLQKSLRAAFSGDVLPGGKAIAHPGATANASNAPSAVDVQSIVPVTASPTSELNSAHTAGSASAAQAGAAAREASEFARLKAEIEKYAASHGFASKVQASIEERGLVIRVLTDDLLFASGQANLNPKGDALLQEIAQLINLDQTHPVDVEGNTDNVPIHSSQFPSNWELSATRASTVVRFLASNGVSPQRLTAVGYADQRPIASDLTAAGRARNRRVEIVLKRIYGSESEP
ncbi:MAG: OmpA family protein [Solirubrobacteraceae bacterium]